MLHTMAPLISKMAPRRWLRGLAGPALLPGKLALQLLVIAMLNSVSLVFQNWHEPFCWAALANKLRGRESDSQLFQHTRGQNHLSMPASTLCRRASGDCGLQLAGRPNFLGGQLKTQFTTQLKAVAEPPTRARPPDVSRAAIDKAAGWTECLLEDRGVTETGEGVGRRDSGHGWEIVEGREAGAALAASAAADAMAAASATISGNRPRTPSFIEAWVFRTSHYGDFERLLKIRSFKPEKTSLRCRERTVDAEVRCAECIRLLRGGHYGSLGISVPAYPPQDSAVGCLQLSKILDMGAELEVWSSPQSLGELGSEQRQTAFCNSINAQLGPTTVKPA